MEFWRYYRIIRRRRWLIILGMAVCVGAVAIINFRAQALYTGRTTLMESRGMSKEGVSVFPDPQSMIMDMQLRLSNLGNIATSQRVIGNALEQLKADFSFPYTTEQIAGGLSIRPDRDTSVLAVEVTLPDAENAKIAADVIANTFKAAYNDLNNTAVKQSLEFIQGQLETTRLELARAQDRLKRYKEESGVVAMDQQNAAAVQRMTQVKTQLSDAGAMYETARAGVRSLEKQLATLPDWIDANKQTTRDPNWAALQDQLIKLEIQKVGMTTGAPGQPKRLANHPDVQFVNAQIEETNRRLRETRETYVAQIGRTRNPNRVSSVDRWIEAKVNEVGASAREKAMNAALAEVRQEIASLPEKEARLTELETDVKAATNTYGLMRTKLDEAKIAEQRARNEQALRTIDAPYVYQVNQRKVLKLILALLLSPLLGIGVAFLLHYTDNSIKTAQDAERLLGLPVYAAVPGARAHSLPRQNCPEIVDVAYQMLTSGLWIASQNHGVNALAIVSAEPDVGRSVTASNLAVALAKEGARVVLVDADLRQPAQHLIFGVENKVGLTNVLSGAAIWDEVLAETRVQGLLLVPSGPTPANPVKLLRSAEMKQFVDEVKQVADFVIFDTPAGVTFPDAVLVSTQVGTAVVVHSAGRVPRGSESELRARLEAVGVRLLGAVLNKVKREDSSGYYHYHRSYQGVSAAQLPGRKKVMTP